MEQQRKISTPTPEQYNNIKGVDERLNREQEMLSQFTPEQQKEILDKQRVLSSLAYFIGKDFRIPIELNQPGAGWHWDFKNNIIRIDPKDLLEKPMDYLRFVISHEGGHRRISRTDFIPPEEWQQPGFSHMMNAIEDPRMNNFVAESYPKFREQMDIAYQMEMDKERIAKEQAEEKLGYQPRFMQAGWEYIKQWFNEAQGKEMKVSEDLPNDVKEVVERTLPAAQDSWWRYPSRQEADKSEEVISQYARTSYEINRDEVWPEFKKLVDSDMEDQKMQEMLQDIRKDQDKGELGEGGEPSFPRDLKDKLTEQEQKELEQAIESAMAKAMAGQPINEQRKPGELGQEQSDQDSQEQEQQPSEGIPINLDSLSESLKQKIREYIESLPEEVKQELAQKAQEALDTFEEELNKELEGKLSENPKEKAERESQEMEEDHSTQETASLPTSRTELSEHESQELKKYRDLVEKSLAKDENAYEKARSEILPIIDKLEQDLREIFTERRAQHWQSGFRTGKKIDIIRRIQEKVKGVPAVTSRAWERKEMPQEKDYSIQLLVDLSGSMDGEKIEETFKAVVVLAEVLNRLSIKTEILGFNDRLYEYQTFDQPMSKEIRQNMGGMLEEVSGSGARWNDDGWALEQASERLQRQKTQEKFLIVLSDGQPVESPKHRERNYELSTVVEKVIQGTDQKLIGLGIGPDTGHVSNYYPNSLANISIDEMAEKLATIIKEAIVNYQSF